MRSIASTTTDYGMSTMKIDDLLDIEDCVYIIGQLYHIMLSGVRVLEALTVEQVLIYDMNQNIANISEETNFFTQMAFNHLNVI